MTNNNNSFNAANSFCSVQNSTSDHGFGLVSLVNCRAFIFMRLTPPPPPRLMSLETLNFVVAIGVQVELV